MLKEMILDFQEAELAIGVARRLTVEVVHGKATVCIGVRRSGKSFYVSTHSEVAGWRHISTEYPLSKFL